MTSIGFPLDDAASVGQLEGVIKAHHETETDVETPGENVGAVDENRGLVVGPGEDHDGLVRRA